MPVCLVDIVRFVAHHQPNIVEARLTDASGNEWAFIDKAAIFTADYLDEDSRYPRPGVLECRIVGRRQDDDGRELVRATVFPMRTVPEIDDDPTFEVFADQIEE